MTTALAPEPAAATPLAIEADRLVVLYDQDCGLCQASARLLERWDRDERLEMLSLQEAAVSGRPAVAAAARSNPVLDRLHVFDEATGRIESGGDAALAIAEVLPGGALIRPFRHVPPFRWIVGAGYELVGRNRHRIGRRLGLEGPACDVPR